MSGLGVDAGLWLQLRAATQGIADTAATAAAMSNGDARAEALAMAAAHGLIDGENGVTVTGGWRKAGKGGDAVFDVTITRPTPLLFARAFISETSGLQVSASAAPDPACSDKPDKEARRIRARRKTGLKKADKHNDAERPIVSRSWSE